MLPYSRERSRDNGSSATVMEFRTFNGSGFSPWYFAHSFTYPKHEQMSDVVTPGFKAIQKRGGIVNNPLSYSRIDTTEPGSVTLKFQVPGQSTYVEMKGDYFGRATLDPLRGITFGAPYSFENLEQQVKLQAIANMDRAEAEMAEDIAELRSLIATIRHPLDTVRPHFKKYRRIRDKHMSAGMTLANAHAQAWLAVRYGVMPSIQSINTAVKVAASWNNKRKTLERQTSRSSMTRMRDIVEDFPTYTNSEATTSGWSVQETVQTVRAGIIYSVRPLVMPGAAEKIGMRLKDLPVTAWNLVPYSWLVDQFVNVSTFIDALVNMSDPSIVIWSGFCTTRTTFRSRVVLNVSSGSYYGNNGAQFTPTKFVATLSRSVWMPRNADVFDGLGLKELRSYMLSSADVAAVVANSIRR